MVVVVVDWVKIGGGKGFEIPMEEVGGVWTTIWIRIVVVGINMVVDGTGVVVVGWLKGGTVGDCDYDWEILIIGSCIILK